MLKFTVQDMPHKYLATAHVSEYYSCNSDEQNTTISTEFFAFFRKLQALFCIETTRIKENLSYLSKKRIGKRSSPKLF